MAADSAISWMKNGAVHDIDEQGWLKLMRVTKIRAGVSYWGDIGALICSPFDSYLSSIIALEKEYDDLATFADHVVASLNKKANGLPLSHDHAVGIHIAGFGPWTDGVVRPMFYHVHNGHGEYRIRQFTHRTGGIDVLERVEVSWRGDPRKLFEKHLDFPSSTRSLQENREALTRGYITRNGSFFEFAVLWKQLELGVTYLNRVKGLSIPNSPGHVGSRKALLHAMLESIVRFYKVSNRKRTVGGKVTSLGIGADGRFW